MKRVKPSDFPELRRAFGGYLHEDSLTEYGSPAAALRAFAADASAAERKRLQRDVRRFLDVTADLEFEKVVELLDRLGARWAPESREALVGVLSGVVDAKESGAS